jgi:hypothetical protein
MTKQKKQKKIRWANWCCPFKGQDGFLKLALGVRDAGLVGSAFLEQAMAHYRELGTNPFGDRFFSMDNDAIYAKAKNAIEAYAADYDANERIIFLYDDTMWNSGKSGRVGANRSGIRFKRLSSKKAVCL